VLLILRLVKGFEIYTAGNYRGGMRDLRQYGRTYHEKRI
jgi:hypothetical protein